MPAPKLVALLADRPFVTEERVRAWQAEARSLVGQRVEPTSDAPPRTVRHTFSVAVTVEAGTQRPLKCSAQHLASGDEASWVGWDLAGFESFVRERIGATDVGDVTSAESEAELVPVRFTVVSLTPSTPLRAGPAIVDLTISGAALDLPPGTSALAEATVYARLSSGAKVEAGAAKAPSGPAGPTNLAIEISASPEWVGLDALVTVLADEAAGPLRVVPAEQATMLVRAG